MIGFPKYFSPSLSKGVHIHFNPSHYGYPIRLLFQVGFVKYVFIKKDSETIVFNQLYSLSIVQKMSCQSLRPLFM